MKNLQKMINTSQMRLIEQEKQIQNKLDALDNYIDNLLANSGNNANEIDEKSFPNEVFSNLKKSNIVLNKLKNNLVKDKNSKIYKNDVKCAISCIANIKDSIKNAQNKLIYAQNTVALKGDIKSADKLAKISFELNFSNHEFVKEASADVVDIKQIMLD